MTRSPSKGSISLSGNGITTRPDGVKEKRVPHHDLAKVQALVVVLGPAALTKVALDGGRAMGLDTEDILKVVAKLDGHCFYKSMTSYADDTEWQDVYRPRALNNRVAYIKLILRPSKPVLQFKER